jgi:hypothetical protein
MTQRPEAYIQHLRDMPWGEDQSVRDAYWVKRHEWEVFFGERAPNGERYLRGEKHDVEIDDEEAVSQPAQLSLFEVLE